MGIVIGQKEIWGKGHGVDECLEACSDKPVAPG